jgi:type I restriction enzyme S subunit
MTGELIEVRTAEEEVLKSGKFLFDEKMVLYSKIRPYLKKVARPEFRGLCSADIYPLSVINGCLDRDYLFHLLLTPAFTDYAIIGSARAGMPKVNRDHLFEFRFSLPPLADQRRIVALLDEAVAGIATAKANAERNRENARTLFESQLKAAFNCANAPSVPIKSFGTIFDGPHATPKTVDSGPIFLGISALKDGRVQLGDTRHVTPEDFKKWTRRVVPQAADIVFSYETQLGQAGLLPEGLECCLGRRMALVRVDRTQVDPRYFTYSFVSPQFRAFLDSHAIRGATVDRISLCEFPTYTMPLPALSEQRRIADSLDSFRQNTDRLESLSARKLAALDELKKALLHQAFSGRL